MNGSPIKRQDEVKNTLPIGRIEGSKTVEAHAPLIRYFINGIGPNRRLSRRSGKVAIGGITDAQAGGRWSAPPEVDSFKRRF